MYVQSDQACAEPNSATPLSAQAISDQDAYIASVGDSFTSGNDVLGQLISQLGGNPVAGSPSVAGGAPGAVGGGDAGVPTVGDPSSLVAPGVSPSAAAPSGAPGTAGHARRHAILRRNRYIFGGGPGGGGFPLGVPAAIDYSRRRSAALADGQNCAAPQVFPLVTVFPVPLVTPSAPAASPAPAVPAAAPAASPAVPVAAAPCSIPSTGNVCADLTLGLLLDSQVDPAQGLYCSENGYQGAHSLPSWVSRCQAAAIAAGTLRKVPYQASPPNTDMQGYPTEYNAFVTSMYAGPPAGMSGLGQAPAPASWAGAWTLLILAAGALYAATKDSGR